MKTKFSFTLALSLSSVLCALCQIPQGYNYQAIARGSDGKELVNTPLQVKLSVLSDTTGFKISGSGTYIWEEQQSATTNSLGLFTLTFGNPLATKIQGSAASFSVIDWKAQPLFIGVKINPNGAGWKILGSAKLWSVPYSMVSGDLSGPVKKLAVSGTTTVMDEALFEVKNKDGQTVFAVYNEGVRIYVDDGVAKGVKGGFAIGSFGTGKAASQPLLVVDPDSIRAYIYDDPLVKRTKGGFAIGGFNASKGITNDYLLVSPDSIRAYITTEAAKGKKGGFAIGGFDRAKAVDGEEYLRVTRDSTRIYVKEQAKGVKGGFAIGSFSPVKAGLATPFTSLEPENYFIGHQGGSKLTTGQFNSTLGYQSGFNLSTGMSNAFMGYQAGYSNTSGTGNLFLGYQSGFSNSVGSNNTFLGYLSGNKNTTGVENTFTGSYSGNNNSIGSNNTFIGFYAGFSNVSGTGNIFEGTRSGYSNTSGLHNVFLGTQSGESNISGGYNVFLGYQAGNKNTSGANNAFMGRLSGFSNTSGYSNVFLGNQAGYTSIDNYENVYIGDRAGYSNKGNWNTMIGFQAGMNMTSGASNVFLGNQAGLNNAASSNVYLGYWAGRANNSTNGQNVMIGRSAGENYIGWQSVIIGPFAGYNGGSAGAGRGNVFLGFNAGYSETGEYKLHIASGTSSMTESLIYGDFISKLLRINGELYLPYKSGNSVLTMTMGAGNGMYFMPGDNEILIKSNHTGNPLVLWLDKYGQAGSGSRFYAAGYTSGGGGINAYSMELGGPSPNSTGAQATLIFHHHGAIAHQLRYNSGVLYFEAAGGGYGTNSTPSLQINGPLYAAVSGGSVGIGTASPGAKVEIVAPGNTLRLARSATSNYFDLGIGIEGYLKVNNQTNSGAYCTGATWVNSSDRNLKENFIPVDGREILEKLDKLPIMSWNYKGESEQIRHVGPVAQDFYGIFSFGNDNKSISTIDPAGISLLAIKELNQAKKIQQDQINLQQKQIESQRLENEKLKSEIGLLREELDQIKTILQNK